jgi:hypothetical protein
VLVTEALQTAPQNTWWSDFKINLATSGDATSSLTLTVKGKTYVR